MFRRAHSILANGLPLVVTPQPHLHGVCIAVAVRCGARDDTARKWGLSHFVEHMMFRGSGSYPDAAALVAPFEQGGGTLQAETWRDHTLFWAVVHPKHVEAALRALGDMMAHPRFDDIELERSLVQAELACDIDESGEDTEMGAVSRKRIWGAHPMGRRIVGSPQSLLGLNLRDVRRRHQKAYVSQNMALSIAGRITPQKAQAMAAQYFAAVPAGPRLAGGRAPTFQGSGIHCCPQPMSQVTLQLSFAAVPDGHPDFTALSLLVSLLDDGMGTRLHRALSEQSGLVYAFETGLDCYDDCGLYDIEMQVAPSRLQAAVAQTAAVLKDVSQGGVSSQELKLAQERALMAIDLGQDSAEDVAQEAAVDVLFSRPNPEHHRANIARTTPGDIARLARTLFCSQQLAVTLMGATHGVNQKALLHTLDDALRPQLGAVKQAPEPLCSRSSVLAARRTRAGQCTKAKPQR